MVAWARPFARRRNRVLLVVLAAVLGTRIALPHVIRRVAVDQADKALVGRIELDDVDLSLLTGGITLHGLRVFANEAAPATGRMSSTDATPPSDTEAAAPIAGEGAPGAAPVFSATRLAVRFGFVALLHRIVEVQRFELDGFAVSLDRAKSGVLIVPAPAPAPEPPPAPKPDDSPGWGVLIRHVALHDGRIGFRDFAVGEPPQRIEGVLPSLEAGNLALLITQGGVEPGTIALDAGIEDGALHLDVSIESRAAGPAYESHLVLTNLPIARGRVYIPRVGWSDLGGRLDLDLVHRFESQGAHTVRGTVALRDVAVRVKDLDEPALAWSGLGIELAAVDLAAQHAEIAAVTLAGARIVTRPAGPEPLPVLRGLVEAAAAGSAAVVEPPSSASAPPSPSASPSAVASPSTPEPPSASAPLAPAIAPSTITAAAPAATPPTAATAPAPGGATARPWTWTLGTVAVRDARVHVLGGDGALDVGVEAEVAHLASAADTHTRVQLTLAPSSGGTIAISGDLTVQPIGFDGTLRVDGLALAPLTQPIATARTRLLRNGVATLALDLAAGATPKAPPNGMRVAGTIGLSDLEVASEDPKPFALRWKDLAIELRELTAPGVLARGADARPGPIGVALGRLALTRPELVATRTEAGIALPAALVGGTAPAATPATTPAATAPAALDVQVRIDTATIEKMRVAFSDESIRPFYRSSLDPIDFRCSDLRWPGPFAKDLRLVAKGMDGATFKVTGNVSPSGSHLVATLDGLPLAPLNPYAAASGYGVAGGRVHLDSDVRLAPGSYKAASKLVLHELEVTGGEGDSLFTSQFGMPLSLALSLMTDLEGNIVLDLPIAGDAKGMKMDLGTLVGNALARAILNAVTSPLKLVGVVAHLGEKPASLTPPPLAFEPGRDILAAGEEQKLEQVGRLLAAAPGLRLHLRGEAGDEDRRWLQEQALRVTLERESGLVGSLRHLGERGARNAALAVLSARATGTSATIPDEHKAWFEAQVAAQPVADETLRALAAARAERTRSQLGSRQGIAADRLLVDEVTPADLAARPAVVIGLGGPAPRGT